ncbi:MAG TPA: hypothetical protein VIH59_22870 [Candidatus Tectomicrobia bacterium]
MASRWWHTPRTAPAVDAWITREFTVRGLAPPDCTPEALARALERERQITIEFRPHASDDPGVYGLLYRPEGCAHTYVIVFRPTYSIALRRLTLFHELAHILFEHPLTEAAGVGTLRGYMVSDQADAMAEAFAVGAMQYSFLDEAVSRAPTDAEDDVLASACGQLLKRTQYRP